MYFSILHFQALPLSGFSCATGYFTSKTSPLTLCWFYKQPLQSYLSFISSALRLTWFRIEISIENAIFLSWRKSHFFLRLTFNTVSKCKSNRPFASHLQIAIVDFSAEHLFQCEWLCAMREPLNRKQMWLSGSGNWSEWFLDTHKLSGAPLCPFANAGRSTLTLLISVSIMFKKHTHIDRNRTF